MNKIIQWNIRGTRVNYSELLLLITKYCPAFIGLQETRLKITPSILKITIRTTILNSPPFSIYSPNWKTQRIRTEQFKRTTTKIFHYNGGLQYSSWTDKIRYQFLKDLLELSINYLLQIFHDIWNSGNIPEIWKQTTVIPIPKPFKDNTSAKKTYRHITLSNCVCKTLERMVNARLIWYLETNKLIT